MAKRVPASMRTRESLSDLIEGRLSSADGRAELVKLATRLIVEEALEAESRDVLTLGEDELRTTDVAVAERGGRSTGVVQVKTVGLEADLLKLFVEPAELRRETGRLLFRWSCRVALDRGARRLSIDADPDAAPFYRRMGARDAGLAPSGSIPGRLLPRLTLGLPGDAP